MPPEIHAPELATCREQCQHFKELAEESAAFENDAVAADDCIDVVRDFIAEHEWTPGLDLYPLEQAIKKYEKLRDAMPGQKAEGEHHG